MIICSNCKHQWLPRTLSPNKCPKCKNVLQKKKREKLSAGQALLKSVECGKIVLKGLAYILEKKKENIPQIELANRVGVKQPKISYWLKQIKKHTKTDELNLFHLFLFYLEEKYKEAYGSPAQWKKIRKQEVKNKPQEIRNQIKEYNEFYESKKPRKDDIFISPNKQPYHIETDANKTFLDVAKSEDFEQWIWIRLLKFLDCSDSLSLEQFFNQFLKVFKEDYDNFLVLLLRTDKTIRLRRDIYYFHKVVKSLLQEEVLG